MSKIKTREKGKDIKVLDKSAVVGQRMKSAFIRSKRNAAALMDDRQTTPSEYAEDKVEFAADDLAHDTANVAVFGTKTAVHQGRNLSQRQWEQRTAEKRRENTAPTEQAPEPSWGTTPPGQPPQRHSGPPPEGRLLRQRTDPPRDEQRPYRSTGTAQGRRFPEVRSQNAANTPRQAETVDNTIKTPIKRAKQSIQAKRQTTKTTDRGAKGTIKSAQRTVKTVQSTANGTMKTAQYTSKTAIKTTDHTAKAAQKTTRDTAKGVSATVKATTVAVKALVAAIAAGGWAAILAIVMICLIGLIVGSCFGIFFSGEDSGAGQTMPAVVREIHQEYEEKLDEIKTSTAYDTLEMSGSCADWRSVLAVYAVKTTTDPDNPQEVTTMDNSKKELLKEIFWAMNEISSRTETATTTQTIETDDGAGNIVVEEVEGTTTTLYITVTHKTADELADAYNFTADQRVRLAELLAEENRSMWSGVLYGIGIINGEVVEVALSQLGNVGGRPYWSWYGFNSRVEWCACFVSWCANECGYLDAGVIPKTAGCISGSNWFKDRGLWQDNSYEPRPGDIIYFDWDKKGSSGPQDGLADHVGIVEKVENGMVYTVEGNSNDSCRENRYAIGDYEIYGYGTPSY